MKKRLYISELCLILCVATTLLCACQASTEQLKEKGDSSTIEESKLVPEQTTVSAAVKENITEPIKKQEPNLDDKAKLALSLIGKTTEETISILGDKYEEELTGDGLMSFSFNDIGMRLIVESYDSTQTDIKVYYIVFDENYPFKGCKSGMLFDQIKKILGDAETVETFVETPDHKAYTLTYTFGNASLEFLSYDKSGRNSNMTLSLISTPEFFKDIGKTLSTLRKEHPVAEGFTQNDGMPGAAAACLGEPKGKYAYYFFGLQDGDFRLVMDGYGDQLKCAGILSTAGVLFPEMGGDLTFSDFFSLIDVSDYEYFSDIGEGQGWLKFRYDNMDVWLNTNESNSRGGWDFTGIEKVKRSAPVIIIDENIDQLNFDLAEAVMFD